MQTNEAESIDWFLSPDETRKANIEVVDGAVERITLESKSSFFYKHVAITSKEVRFNRSITENNLKTLNKRLSPSQIPDVIDYIFAANRLAGGVGKFLTEDNDVKDLAKMYLPLSSITIKGSISNYENPLLYVNLNLHSAKVSHQERLSIMIDYKGNANIEHIAGKDESEYKTANFQKSGNNNYPNLFINAGFLVFPNYMIKQLEKADKKGSNADLTAFLNK